MKTFGQLQVGMPFTYAAPGGLAHQYRKINFSEAIGLDLGRPDPIEFQPSTEVLVYDPMGEMLPEQKIGQLYVKGNDSFATVSYKGIATFVAIEHFDNCIMQNETEVSAFKRAVRWAEQNQSDPRIKSGGLFGS